MSTTIDRPPFLMDVTFSAKKGGSSQVRVVQLTEGLWILHSVELTTVDGELVSGDYYSLGSGGILVHASSRDVAGEPIAVVHFPSLPRAVRGLSKAHEWGKEEVARRNAVAMWIRNIQRRVQAGRYQMPELEDEMYEELQRLASRDGSSMSNVYDLISRAQESGGRDETGSPNPMGALLIRLSHGWQQTEDDRAALDERTLLCLSYVGLLERRRKLVQLCRAQLEDELFQRREVLGRELFDLDIVQSSRRYDNRVERLDELIDLLRPMAVAPYCLAAARIQNMLQRAQGWLVLIDRHLREEVRDEGLLARMLFSTHKYICDAYDLVVVMGLAEELLVIVDEMSHCRHYHPRQQEGIKGFREPLYALMRLWDINSAVADRVSRCCPPAHFGPPHQRQDPEHPLAVLLNYMSLDKQVDPRDLKVMQNRVEDLIVQGLSGEAA